MRSFWKSRVVTEAEESKKYFVRRTSVEGRLAISILRMIKSVKMIYIVLT